MTTVTHCASPTVECAQDGDPLRSLRTSDSNGIMEDTAIEKDVDLSSSSGCYTESGDFVPYFTEVDSLDETDFHGHNQNENENVSRIDESAGATSAQPIIPHTYSKPKLILLQLIPQNVDVGITIYLEGEGFMRMEDGEIRASSEDDLYQPADTVGKPNPQRSGWAAIRSVTEYQPDDSEYIFNNDDENDGNDDGEVDYFCSESPTLSSPRPIEATEGHAVKKYTNLSRTNEDYMENGDFVPYFNDEDSPDEGNPHQNVSGSSEVTTTAPHFNSKYTVNSIILNNHVILGNVCVFTGDSASKCLEDDDFMWTGDDDIRSSSATNEGDTAHQPADTTEFGKSVPRRAAFVSSRLASMTENHPDDTEYVFDDFQEDTDTASKLSLPTLQTVQVQEDVTKKTGSDAAKKFKYPYLKGQGSTILMDDCVQIHKRHGNYSANKSKILTSIPKQSKTSNPLDSRGVTSSSSSSVGVSSQPVNKLLGQQKSVVVTATKQTDIEQSAVSNDVGVNIDNREESGLDTIPQVATVLSTSVSNAEDAVHSPQSIDDDRSRHVEDTIEAHMNDSNSRSDSNVSGGPSIAESIQPADAIEAVVSRIVGSEPVVTISLRGKLFYRYQFYYSETKDRVLY